MPSLKDVAREAGVSVSTCSKVLNRGKECNRISDACAEKVRAAARRINYVPNYHAQRMRKARSAAVGVVLSIDKQEELVVAPSYFGLLVGGMERQARRAGRALTLIGPYEHETAVERGLRHLRQKRLDGLVVPGIMSRFVSPPILEVSGHPVVLIDYDGPTRLPVIEADLESGMRMALEHLAELGHRRVLYLGPLDRPKQRWRAAVFAAQAAAAQLQGLHCRYPRPPIGDERCAEIDAAREAMAAWLASEHSPVTAVIGFNDQAAVAAYAALRAVGRRVPEDVSVIGIDNICSEMATPQLTTIDHGLTEMGGRAVELILGMTQGGKARQAEMAGHREQVRTHLVVRSSTGPAPGC